MYSNVLTKLYVVAGAAVPTRAGREHSPREAPSHELPESALPRKVYFQW